MAVMALERVPADIRADGGVARMSDPDMIKDHEARPLAVPDNKKRLVSKIRAILLDQGLKWNYADGISQQMFKIDRVEWCTPAQLYTVIQALSYHQNREGGIAC